MGKKTETQQNEVRWFKYHFNITYKEVNYEFD